MRTHVQVVAWLTIALNVVMLIFAAVFMLFFLGIGGLAASGDPNGLPVFALFGGFGALIVGLIALSAIPGVVAGIGLLGRANWARILAIVLAVLNLMNFPFGTAVSVYTLVVLFHPETALMFERRPF